jgi:hypothetical protein
MMAFESHSFAASESVQTHEVAGGEAIGLYYVQDVITAEEADYLVKLCDSRNGWTSSPSRHADDGVDTSLRETRTSSSCPLIWPLLYLPHMDELRDSGRLTVDMESEVRFTWRLSQRLAGLLEVDETHLEPLQLVRYETGQHYSRHHDHGAYYGVPSEHRPMTMLVRLKPSCTCPTPSCTRFVHLPCLTCLT